MCRWTARCNQRLWGDYWLFLLYILSVLVYLCGNYLLNRTFLQVSLFSAFLHDYAFFARHLCLSVMYLADYVRICSHKPLHVVRLWLFVFCWPLLRCASVIVRVCAVCIQYWCAQCFMLFFAYAHPCVIIYTLAQCVIIVVIRTINCVPSRTSAKSFGMRSFEHCMCKCTRIALKLQYLYVLLAC